MGLLSASDAEQVRKLFAGMTRDVAVRLYTQKLNCDSCLDTERIIAELSGLSDRIKVETLNALTDTDRREADGVEVVPALIVSDGTHARTRFYGAPSGYEFTSLLTSIVDAGTGGDTLEPATIELLDRLDTDLVIKVFVTPTCPYCPRAAVLAMRMAARSPRVRAEVVEANEFPDISRRYRVQGVPRTVVNDLVFVEGALPESALVKGLALALPKLGDGSEINLQTILAEAEEPGAGEAG
jgi:glutaredoxin-like protein